MACTGIAVSLLSICCVHKSADGIAPVHISPRIFQVCKSDVFISEEWIRASTFIKWTKSSGEEIFRPLSSQVTTASEAWNATNMLDQEIL